MSDAKPLKSKATVDVATAAPGGAGNGQKGKTVGGSDQGPDKAALFRARKAYDNAKYRYTKSLAGYETVKFNLPSFKDFIAVIGLPKPGESLDRIDPNGHYEIGNVRWTNNAVQAANKKNSTGGSTLPLHLMVAQAHAAASCTADRRAVSDAWMGYIAVYGRVPALVPGNLNELAEQCGLAYAWGNSFHLDDLPDSRHPEGIFHLPSLTEPGRLVRIRGGPFHLKYCGGDSDRDASERRRRWASRGLIEPFSKETNALNFSPLELQQRVSDLKNLSDHGVCWVGRPTAGALLAGWFEGRMLALACRLSAVEEYSAIYPAQIALERWSSFKYPNDDDAHTVVDDCDYLFIPDFQVDAGIGWRSTNSELFRLTELVRHRVAAKKKTCVGIQNPNALPADVRNFLFANLSVRKIDPTAQVPHPDKQHILAAIKTARAEQGMADVPPPRLATEDMIEAALAEQYGEQ